jgi:hypothetical protein
MGLGLGALLLSCAGLGGCHDETASDGASTGSQGTLRTALTAACLPSGGSAPAGAWICPAPLSLACVDGTGAANPPTLYVPASGDAGSCDGQSYAVQVDSLRVGEHDVIVRDQSGALVCQAELTVTDTVAPVLTPKPQLKLWPPNHKFHSISVDDCFSVSDACEGPLQAEFVWASSDEPIDSIGDGHHAPDIQVANCRAIALRAERQGPKEGRVYKLGVRVVDRAGNATEGVCSVIVDHDQRGVDGADSGEAYRVTFNGTNGLPQCDGDQPPPPTNPPGNPPPGNPPPGNPPPGNPPPGNPPSDPPPSDPPPSDPPPPDGPGIVD